MKNEEKLAKSLPTIDKMNAEGLSKKDFKNSLFVFLKSRLKQLAKFNINFLAAFLFAASWFSCYTFCLYHGVKVTAIPQAQVEFKSNSIDQKKLIADFNGDSIHITHKVNPQKFGKQEMRVEVQNGFIKKEVALPVQVVDTTPPQIALRTPSLTITEGESIDLSSNIASVIDSKDGALPAKTDVAPLQSAHYALNTSSDLSAPGKHEVTVTATDACGNTATTSFEVEVKQKAPTPKPVTPKTSSAIRQPSSQTDSATAPIAPSNIDTSSVLAVATSWLGQRSGKDCSAFTQYVFGCIGISIPRTAGAQATVGANVGANLAMARPGDLVIYNNGHHVAIYVGNNTIIHSTGAWSGGMIKYAPADKLGQRVTAIRRI